MLPATRETDGSTTLLLDASAYSLEAIQKAAHKFTASFVVAITMEGAGKIRCNLKTKAGGEPNDAVEAFFNEMLDQQLRLTLRRETEAVRRIILAQAFSRTDAPTMGASEEERA